MCVGGGEGRGINSLTPVSKFYPGWLTVDTHQILGVETSAQLTQMPKAVFAGGENVFKQGTDTFQRDN